MVHLLYKSIKMIAAFLTEVETLIGTDIGSRKYASVVPVYATFPCFMFKRVFTDAYQTKTDANRSKTRIRGTVFVRDSVSPDSAFVLAYNIAETLKDGINGLVVSGTEYRVEDITDGYNEETELYFTTMDIEVQHNF